MRIAAGALLAVLSAAPALAAQNSNCLPTTGVVSGLQMVTALNSGATSILSSFSGNTAPVTDCSGATLEGQPWYDTSASIKYWKIYDGTTPIPVFAIDPSSHQLVPQVGGGSQPTLVSASTVDLGADPHAAVFISGTTTINSFGSSAKVGSLRFLTFTGALTVTYNSTSMILPGGQSLTTAPGDTWTVEYLGSGNWRARQVQLAAGTPLYPVPTGTSLDWNGFTAPSGFLIEDGSAVSRSTYSALFAVITFQSSGATTFGSTTISGLSSTANIGPGMAVCGPGVPNGAVVTAIDSSTAVEMSLQGTLTATNTITIAPNGCGDGSTTFNLPDSRGRVVAGRDPSGTTMTAANSGIYAQSLGATGGVPSFNFARNQLPNEAPTFAGTPATITVNSAATDVLRNPSGIQTTNSGTGFGVGSGPSGQGGYQIASSGSYTPGGTVGSLNGGVSQVATRVVQPTAIKVRIIKY